MTSESQDRCSTSNVSYEGFGQNMLMENRSTKHETHKSRNEWNWRVLNQVLVFGFAIVLILLTEDGVLVASADITKGPKYYRQQRDRS